MTDKAWIIAIFYAVVIGAALATIIGVAIHDYITERKKNRP
jgi:hypothetical protein